MTGIINVDDGAVAETPDAAIVRGKTEQAATLAAGTKAYDTSPRKPPAPTSSSPS